MEGEKKDIISIPLYFHASKDLFIGKGCLKGEKSNFKFTKPNNPVISHKYSIKEFKLINKDKSKSNIIYNGREAPQDSYYILMKYDYHEHAIQMCPANKWANFTQSFNYKEQKISDIEKQKKEQIKEQNKNIKQLFNFDVYSEMRQEKPKKNPKKKKGLLPDKEDDLDDNNEKEVDYGENDDDEKPKKKKKNKYDFDEDSHSSEDSLGLKEDSYESEDERKREEKRIREEEEEKRKEEEKKKQKEKEKDDYSNDDEDDDDDDKSFDDMPSDVDEKDLNSNKWIDLLSNKRKRENEPEEKIKEELSNLLRKKNKRTYDDIVAELLKTFKSELVDQWIDKLLEENTSKFVEQGATYYFLK